MYKKSIAVVLALLMTFTLVACSKPVEVKPNAEQPKAEEPKADESKAEEPKAEEPKAEEPKAEEPKDGEPAEFHIGIITGTVSQSEDDLRGAEELIARYGDSADGGMITHLTYPDNFTSEQETTISQIVGLADDPLMKAIIVNQAVPGTAAAFAQLRKEGRDDLLLLAGEPHDDPSVIDPVADFSIGTDNINRGYLIPYVAKELGAKTVVHVSFPRHLSYAMMSLRHAIMKQSCEDLGLKFADETVPDPTSDVGVPGAQQFILEHVGEWVKKYGKDTAFFCTNDAETEPLLKKIAELGAIFVEADLPSPLMGYPGAFGIDLKDVAGDFPAILKKVEETVVKAGGSGRMGTWAYSYGFTTSAGLGEFAKRVIEGKYTKDDKGNYKIDDVLEALQEYTPGAKWAGMYFLDNSGEKAVEHTNHLLIFQDCYIFGKGYIPTTQVEVEEKYRLITAEAPAEK